MAHTIRVFSSPIFYLEVASASAPGRLEDGGEAGLERGAGEMVLAGPPRIGDSGGAVHMVWEQESVRHLQVQGVQYKVYSTRCTTTKSLFQV